MVYWCEQTVTAYISRETHDSVVVRKTTSVDGSAQYEYVSLVTCISNHSLCNSFIRVFSQLLGLLLMRRRHKCRYKTATLAWSCKLASCSRDDSGSCSVTHDPCDPSPIRPLTRDPHDPRPMTRSAFYQAWADDTKVLTCDDNSFCAVKLNSNGILMAIKRCSVRF